MSLQLNKQLADLKEKSDKYYGERNEVRTQKRAEIIDNVKNHFISYLTEQGFQCDENHHSKLVNADYKGDIKLSFKYDDPTTNYMGCDGAFEISRISGTRSAKQVKSVFVMESENLPSFNGFFRGEEDRLKSEIKFYEEELLPAQKRIGTSDLTGEYSLGVFDPDTSRGLSLISKTIPELIDEVMS
ncbi:MULTISPECIES: hypothetical protein [Vibrio oreintalis group]|uniref:hypothetical protein n=1 Tax=Vibrio oreintalis group TaxID=1891919 RepID=UPI00234F4CD7|nr:hypothetical protein [Vibrio tubiashii]WCP70304.1 hypothetical protein LYZ37_23030 [Vibrio tubiashii]